MKAKAKTFIRRVVVCVLVLVTTYVVWSLSAYLNEDTREKGTNSAINLSLANPSDQIFEPVLPHQPVVLPKDFAFHNSYQHEWWHYFANVKDQYGEKYGIKWSYFRIARHDNNWSGWLNPQLFISYIVVTHGDKVWKEQRIARGGIGQAGMNSHPFEIWIDNWNWRSFGNTPLPGQLTISADEFNVDLTSVTQGSYILPGDKGYRQKHDLLPISSYNLAAPSLRVTGLLNFSDGRLLNLQGEAWMSKEWGSDLISDDQQGWDWFVLHLDNKQTLSLTRYRHKKQPSYLFGTLVTKEGKVINLASERIVMQPLRSKVLTNNKVIPIEWLIEIPDYNISLTTNVTRSNSNRWLPFVIPYWESPISAYGTQNAEGFVQLSGY